eukprot:SAG11_NODE_698_length_7682_cov_6.090993_3_plen_153_part_00
MVPSQVPWCTCVVKTCLKNSDTIWSINLARSVSSEFTYFLCTELVSITCTNLVQYYHVPLPGYVYCGILVPIKVVFLQYGAPSPYLGLGGEFTSHPLLLTVYRLTGVPNTGGSAIVYILAEDDTEFVSEADKCRSLGVRKTPTRVKGLATRC